MAVLGLILLVALNRARDGVHLGRSALLLLPLTIASVLVVSAPDIIEQIVLGGF